MRKSSWYNGVLYQKGEPVKIKDDAKTPGGYSNGVQQGFLTYITQYILNIYKIYTGVYTSV